MNARMGVTVLRWCLLGTTIGAAARGARFPALLAGMALHWTWILPAITRNGGWNGPLIKRFATDRREVWLTIDDGPDPGDTREILDILRARNARASFFMIGRKVDANRALARAVADAGHGVENHTHTHPAGMFWSLPGCCIREEIRRCNHAILSATGRPPRFFRSPAGMTNASVRPAAAKSWLRLCGWSADALDGLPGCDSTKAMWALGERACPGDILLIHQGGRSDRAAAVDLLLHTLEKRGLRCVIPAPSKLLYP